MCIYIPHWIVALFDFLPFFLIGGMFGFLAGKAFAEVEYEEEENEKNKKRRL